MYCAGFLRLNTKVKNGHVMGASIPEFMSFPGINCNTAATLQSDGLIVDTDLANARFDEKYLGHVCVNMGGCAFTGREDGA